MDSLPPKNIFSYIKGMAGGAGGWIVQDKWVGQRLDWPQNGPLVASIFWTLSTAGQTPALHRFCCEVCHIWTHYKITRNDNNQSDDP